MNFTVEAPEGTTHHGDPKLICKPPNWKAYRAFYALNYLIHAATIPSVPGETKSEIVFAVLNALFIPGFGVLRAIRRLMLRPRLRRKTPLECANAAGALCMVVSDRFLLCGSLASLRGGWIIRSMESFKNCWFPRHARYTEYATYPLDAGSASSLSGLEPASSPDPQQVSVFEPASEYNVVKIFFSLVQAVAPYFLPIHPNYRMI
jgi:hypothetical protein